MFILVKTPWRDHLVNVSKVEDITTYVGVMNDHVLVFRQPKEQHGNESLRFYFRSPEEVKAAFEDVQKQLLGEHSHTKLSDGGLGGS